MIDSKKKYWEEKLEKEYVGSQHVAHPTPFAKFVQNMVLTRPGLEILELGSGLGQDALYFALQGHKVIATDMTTFSEDSITKIKQTFPHLSLHFHPLDLAQGGLQFPQEKQFDLVYAHLSLHYFSTDVLRHIILKIRDVLKPGGSFGTLLNAVTDKEYGHGMELEEGFFELDGSQKRYFSPESWLAFVQSEFQTVLCDTLGETVKDNLVKNTGLVRYLGKK